MIRCDKCRYWERRKGLIGVCRRHAPRAPIEKPAADRLDFEAMLAIWPLTRSTDGCGDGAPRQRVSRELTGPVDVE